MGMVLEHVPSTFTGAVVRYRPGQVTLEGRKGDKRVFVIRDGVFAVDGEQITLGPPLPANCREPELTASGSIDPGRVVARVARASRILVEGIHDAELVEKIWGDDLRVEGVVVEQLEGADDLAEIVRAFDPQPTARLGVLLDHLVAGSKEARIAHSVDSPHVLICGHPYVDIWQAVKPAVVGIEAWPEIPRGQSWKEGVLATLGFRGTPGEFWKQLLGRVKTYRDLEPTLLNAVEQLIDFVAPPPTNE